MSLHEDASRESGSARPDGDAFEPEFPGRDLASIGPVEAVRRPEPHSLVARTERAALRIRWIRSGIVHLAYGSGFERIDAQRSSPVLDPALELRPPDCTVDRSDGRVTVRSEDLRLVLETDRLALTVYGPAGNVLTEDAGGLLATTRSENENSVSAFAVEKHLRPGESLYGLGESAGPFDRRGTTVELSDPAGHLLLGVDAEAEGAYGLLFDRTAPLRFALDPDEEQRTRIDADRPYLSFYLLVGPTPKQVLARIADLTGRAPRPPRWALGLHRRAAGTTLPEDVERLVRSSRHTALPLEAVYVGERLVDSIEEAAGPNSELRSALRRDELRVVVPVETPTRPTSATTRDDESPRDSPSSSEDRRIAAQLERGADGFATSQEASTLRSVRSVYHAVRRAQSGLRPFVVGPRGTLGIHRYAATWLCAPLADRDDLAERVRRCLTLSTSGIPFVGFNPHPRRADDLELLLRGLQTAVVLPFLGVATDTDTQRPLGLSAANEEFIRVYRRALHLRYKLLPYLYGTFETYRRTGCPPLRPAFVERPDCEPHRATTDVFYLGAGILAAPPHPVDHEETSELKLPPGRWFEFQSHRPCDRVLELDRPRYPLLFVRGGTVLPLQPLSRRTRPPVGTPLVLRCYPHDERTSSVYLDDGRSLDHRDGQFRHLRIHSRSRARSFHVSVERRGTYRGDRRVLEWQIPRRNWETVRVDEQPIEVTRNPELFVRDTSLAYRGRQFLRIRTKPDVRSISLDREGD